MLITFQIVQDQNCPLASWELPHGADDQEAIGGKQKGTAFRSSPSLLH